MDGTGGYLTTSEAARIAGVSQETVIQWCREGDVICAQNGHRHWRVEKTSLMHRASVEDVRKQPAAEAPGSIARTALWEQRWQDRTLRAFGEWLSESGIADEEATYVVASVWAYYSYTVVPAVLDYPPMALSVAHDERGAEAWLHLPHEFANRRLRAADVKHIKQAFSLQFQKSVVPNLSLHLDFAGVADALADDVSQLCLQNHRTFLGVYEDNLEAELTTIMRPDGIRVWLNTANDAYDGKPPRLLIRDPEQDHLIRDLIMGVKYGAVA